MADFCDVGSERTQQMLDDALAARRAVAERSAIDHPYCDSCGVDIPLKRREFLPGVETCVDCQAMIEQMGVRRG